MLSVRDAVYALGTAAMMAACASWAAGQQPVSSSRSAEQGTPQQPPAQGAGRAVPQGSPQEAFRTLGFIPRPGTAATATRPAGGRGFVSARVPEPVYSTPRYIPMWSPNLARPSSPRGGAGPQQVAVSTPDEEDLRSAGLREPHRPPTGNNLPPSIGGYRGFGEYGYGPQGYYDSRRAVRWPEYRYSRVWTETGGAGGAGQPGVPGGLREDFDSETYGDGIIYDGGYGAYIGNARTESLIKSSITSMDRGLAAFREGRYREAADAFRLAADAHQGDPAARIYAGHALFATGRYRAAVKYIRSALELQPRIIFLTYDMRSDYRERSDFERHQAALEEALSIAPQDQDRLFMLGYVQYYGGHRDGAYFTFERLLRAHPRDKLAADLMENSEPPDVVADAPRPHRPQPRPER